MVLGDPERIRFRESGVLSLKGAIPKREVAAVKRSLIAELDRLKLRVNGRLVSSKIENLPPFQQTGRLGQMIRSGPEVDRLFSPELFASMGSLTSSKLRKPSTPRPSAQLLISFPHKEEWSLARLNWHLDLKVPKKDEVPGVQAFILIDDVQPRGGATLALAGSHRLHYLKDSPGNSAHAILRQHPKFGDLFNGGNPQPEALFKPQIIDGVEVYIVEMAGQAGDVFLMDLRTLHSPSVNATKHIRMMATARLIL
jgi:hypothetical protein